MRKVFSSGLFLLLVIGLPVIAGAQGVAVSTAVAPAVEEAAAKGMTFMDLIKAGGVVMYPLAVCSFFTVFLGIYFLFALRERKIFAPEFISSVHASVAHGDIAKAQEECKKNPGLVASLFSTGLKMIDKPMEEIRGVVEHEANHTLIGTRKNIDYLNILGVISPMLGLLGTVMGMISCFNTIATRAGAVGNPKLLAGGISQALVTTATGLPIGIMAFLLYIYFRGKVDVITSTTDRTGEDFFRLLETAKNSNKINPKSE